MAKTYKRGECDVTNHQATYDAFMAISKWGSLIIAVGVLFFSAWLASPLSWFTAAFLSGVVAVVGGWYLLTAKGH